MNILLNGATAGSNFGDFLFAKAFQDYVGNIVGKENVYWYNSRYAMSDFYASRLNNNRTALKNIDALVYISGGYFCGNDKTLKDTIIRYLSYFHIGMRCIAKKIPYAIIGLEVGVPKSRFMYRVQKKILKNASVIVVRNQNSIDALKEYGIENAICTADTVFALDADFYKGCEIDQRILINKGKRIFLHVDRYMGSLSTTNTMIVEKIVPVLNAFLSEHMEYDVIVGTDQDNPDDEGLKREIVSKIKADNVVLNKFDDPVALMNVIGECDVVITHKLHVGIVGAKLSKSVISFSGHTEKIKRLYEQLGVLERTTPLNELEFEKGLKMLEEYHDIPIVVSDEIINMAKSNFEILRNFISGINEELK